MNENIKEGVLMSTRNTIPPLKFEVMAEKITQDYFDKKASLHDLVKKASIDNELTPQQIARLSQLSNIKTYQKLFDGEKDKLFEFHPVDYRQIVKEFNMPEDADERILHSKDPWDISIGDFITDVFWKNLKRNYNVDKPIKEDDIEEEFINKIVGPEWGTKKSPKKLEIAVEKLKSLLETFDETQRIIKIKAADILEELRNILKQDYLNKIDLNLPYTAISRETGTYGGKVFKDVVDLLKKDGVIKEAAYEPTVLIDKEKSSVNPCNPVITHIKNLSKYEKDYALMEQAKEVVLNKMQYVKSKLEEVFKSKKQI